MFRCFLALSFLLAPLYLCGCGTVSTVRTAFEMPVAPTPSAQELARAKKSRAFDSLSKAIGQLNAQTLQPFLNPSDTKATTARPSRQPSPFASDPARALASDLNRGANVPVSPRPLGVSVAPVAATTSTNPSFSGRENTRTVAGLQIQSAPLVSSGAGTTRALLASLRAWEARESLRRADEELLGRRALEDRIALQSSGARPRVDLSLVSPETQLELSNLRLKLLPLLSVAPTKRAEAAAQIQDIEARLKAIWEGETARQDVLLRQSLVEVPARLRVEGESALEKQTRQDIAQTQTRLAKVQRDLEARLNTSRPSPALGVALRAATAPNPKAIGAWRGSPIGDSRNEAKAVPPTFLSGTTEIARRGANASNRTARTVAAKNQSIWRTATR